jgi:hypothetical protein
MKTTRSLATLLLLLLALAACTTIGTGSGQMAGAGAQGEPVTFNWTSTDGGMSGTMRAALPDATFEGHFFQITQQTRGEVLTPLWTHWHRGWYDWPYWSGPVHHVLLRQGGGNAGSAGQPAHALPLSPG